MAAHVQTANSLDNSVASQAYGSNVVSGNLGILWARTSTGDGTLTGITDSLGSTWTKVGSDVSATTGLGALWYTVFPSSGANTVSLTGATSRMLLEEVSGLTTATLDSTNQNTGIGTAVASGNISPAVASWIFAGMVTLNYPATSTAGSGFTGLNLADLNKYGGEYQNSASGGTYSGDFTIDTNTWGAIVAAFKSSGAADVLMAQALL